MDGYHDLVENVSDRHQCDLREIMQISGSIAESLMLLPCLSLQEFSGVLLPQCRSLSSGKVEGCRHSEMQTSGTWQLPGLVSPSNLAWQMCRWQILHNGKSRDGRTPWSWQDQNVDSRRRCAKRKHRAPTLSSSFLFT